MYAVLILLHIVVCVILILVVLLQTGKGADLAGAFGGGGSQTALGSRGAATFLSKATTVSAILFMFTSLALAIMSSRRTSAILEGAPVPASTVPAGKSPAPPPATNTPTQPASGGSEPAKPPAPEPTPPGTPKK